MDGLLVVDKRKNKKGTYKTMGAAIVAAKAMLKEFPSMKKINILDTQGFNVTVEKTKLS